MNTIARMKAIDAMSTDQPAETIEALRRLLCCGDQHEALRNNVANKLRQCGDERLVTDLTDMLWDEKETPKWRNYCAQHLYTCYEKEPDPAIPDTLFRADKPATGEPFRVAGAGGGRYHEIRIEAGQRRESTG